MDRRPMLVFSGNAHPALARAVCDYLDIPLGNASITRFPDGELNVKVNDDVRGADAFVVQPTCHPVNDNLMELLMLIDCLRRASADRITAVLPYYGYARKDRKDEGRVPITAKLVANLITQAGANRALAVDLHASQIQGFFDIPVDHLYASGVLVRQFLDREFDDLVVVSPDVGSIKLARAYAELLGAGLAVVDKRRISPKETAAGFIIGEVRGGEAFDLIQSMNTGHSGSMCTVHANSPVDTCRRIESLCLMSSVEIPMVAVRAQVASAINIVICCARFQDGSRRVTHISEVLPLNERGDYRTQDLFVYTITGKDKEGNIQGYHAPTGILPTFITKLRAYGFSEMTDDFFDPATYGVEPPPVRAVQEIKVTWIPRLEGGREQFAAKPADEEWKQQLQQALEQSLSERDLEPPPMVDADQATPAGGGEASAAEPPPDSPAEDKPAPDQPERGERPQPPAGGDGTSSPGRRVAAGSYARQLLGQTKAKKVTRPARLPIGVRPPGKRGSDSGGKGK